MTIKEKQQQYIEDLAMFEDWDDKYQYIIDLAEEEEPFPPEEKNDKNKISGCQSQVWFLAKFENGKINFWADSDSVLVKGLTAMLVDVYSGHTPDEIISNPPDFLETIGLTNHLSPTRKNGLNSMVKQIQMYAVAFKAMEGK
jgi:cysteine desulfuration protein SufE